ncbi:N-acetyl-alpha-D-glucosaminyl L-malate synthase [bacterium HR30]|nr:N-acetyl-alpha-D-glucosaminyl L-malate synthase [bacterium HR30]
MGDIVRVLVVEASSGGVVGGSLTGLYHMIRGFDRTRYKFAMALYEPKTIEADLSALGVPVYHLSRRRLPKKHALQTLDSYHAIRRVGLLRSAMHDLRIAAGTLVEDLPAALGCVRVLRAFRPDLVHVGNGLRANFDALFACSVLNIPTVCHIKGFEKYSARERWLARRVSALVCMTKAVLDHCKQNGVVSRRGVVIYDALDPVDFTPRRPAAAVRAELGVPEGAPLIGVVGNVQEWKGQIVLVEALAQLVSRVPDVRGVIVGGVHRAGDRYFQALLERAKELGVSDRLVVTGFRTDVADIVNALDVLVHTSVRPEPFGRVILEGMMSGKPVVATDAGGVPELIEHGQTGLLVPPGQAGALADAIATLLGSPDARQAMGERAKTWATQRFSLARHVEEFDRLYRAVLEESRNG